MELTVSVGSERWALLRGTSLNTQMHEVNFYSFISNYSECTEKMIYCGLSVNQKEMFVLAMLVDLAQ
jgi:hypothetical protein